MESIIRDIADTARWVAVFRAEESERADAVFRDPYARRLAGERGEQIASAMEFSRANSWSFVARTYLFDAAIERWRDIWINEGLATYAEWLWLEHEGESTPREAFEAVGS